MADPNDDAGYGQMLDAITVGGARPLQGRIEIRDHDPEWPLLYEREAQRLGHVLGERIVRLEHVGSTSVPGLPAKPIIDMALEVADSSDEAAYARDLEDAGYVLRIREPQWFEHRMFKGPDVDVNLHVFSADCEETQRMLAFRDRLRTSPADREYYARVKRELSARDWKYVQQYADAKTDVIAKIIEGSS